MLNDMTVIPAERNYQLWLGECRNLNLEIDKENKDVMFVVIKVK